MSKLYLRQFRYRLPGWILWTSGLTLGLLILVGLAVRAGYLHLIEIHSKLPPVAKLKDFEPSQTTRIYDAKGRLIGTLFKENRTWIPLKKVSPWMIKAVIAIEDSRFFKHKGVDPIGVARAAWVDLTSKNRREGASTITMQLARLMFLKPERTLKRKIREAMLAVEIERQFSKKEILELYLNQIYFGAGTYGVQAASSYYFNKSASKLTPAQAALIAGLPQAPSELSPFVNPKAARQRQMMVLNRMHQQRFLTWAQYKRAVKEVQKQKFRRRPGRQPLLKVPYFTAYVIKELSKRYSQEQLYKGGLRIYTTVDTRLQKHVENEIKYLVAQDEWALNVHQAAAVVIENKTGYVRAMVGGRGFTTKNQFNRAWQARRQVGSSFKPFVYTAALLRGYNPNSIVQDSPTRFVTGSGEVWEPKNADGRWLGSIPLWLALQTSRNMVAARMIAQLGPTFVADLTQQFGLDRPEATLSLSLGTAEASPLQMASAYSVFPNQGVLVQPTAILRVIDAKGKVLEDNRKPRRRMVIPPETAQTMVWMLRKVVEAGTGRAADLYGGGVAGKTGTTDSHRDAWFCGFTRNYTTAVWIGNDDYSRMWSAFGGDLPARIFRTSMNAALKGRRAPRLTQERPVAVSLCRGSHMRPNPECASRITVYFAKNLVPTERCSKHRSGTSFRLDSYPARGAQGGRLEAPLLEVPAYPRTRRKS